MAALALPALDAAWLEEPDGSTDIELLDWLLPGGGGASALDEWQAAASGSLAALPLRCLKSSHARGCVACLPPPPAGEEALYLLRAPGDAEDAEGGPSGSNRLRAQLLATAEWNSAAARDALAAAEEARGDPVGVVTLLRKKLGKALLKPQMLLLARAWGYSSDLWCRRGDARASRKRARAAPDASQPRSAASPPRSGGSSAVVSRPLAGVESLALSRNGEPSALRALWRPSADRFLGSACRAECDRAGVAFFNAAIDAEYAVFDAGAARVVAQMTSLEAAQASWNGAVRARLLSQPGGDAARASTLPLPDSNLPLCMAVCVQNCDQVPAEQGLHCLLAAVTSFQSAWMLRRASASRVLAESGASIDLAPVDAEIEALYAHFRRFIAEGLLVLQFLKARGSCADYLAAAADVAHELTRFVKEIRANMADQHAWYARQCASGALAPLPAAVENHDYERILGSLIARVESVQVHVADSGASATTVVLAGV